jgi:hypothetical protein
MLALIEIFIKIGIGSNHISMDFFLGDVEELTSLINIQSHDYVLQIIL